MMTSFVVSSLKRLTPILRPKMQFLRTYNAANKIVLLAKETKNNIRNVGYLFGIVSASQSLQIDSDSNKVEPKLKLNAADPERLTYSFLIKQAASNTVDAATTVLTQTAVAILEIEIKYREELEKLIKLMEYHHATLGTLDESSLWDQIVAIRSESESSKRKISEMEVFFQSVTQLMNAAAETALNADCEYGSVAASERLQSANNELEFSKEKTKELERKYLELYSKVIRETVCEEHSEESNN